MTQLRPEDYRVEKKNKRRVRKRVKRWPRRDLQLNN